MGIVSHLLIRIHMTTTISGSNGIVFPDATSMQTGQQAVKAWVNFNGTGVVAIRASYGVSSLTDYAQGQYRVNFTTAMPDVNYGITVGISSSASDSVWPVSYITNASNGGASSTSSLGLNVGTIGGATLDAVSVNVAIFR
jgi:hypothetical protein